MSATTYQQYGDTIAFDSPMPKFREFGGLYDSDGHDRNAVTIDTVLNHFGEVWIEVNGTPICRL